MLRDLIISVKKKVGTSIITRQRERAYHNLNMDWAHCNLSTERYNRSKLHGTIVFIQTIWSQAGSGSALPDFSPITPSTPNVQHPHDLGSSRISECHQHFPSLSLLTFSLHLIEWCSTPSPIQPSGPGPQMPFLLPVPAFL